jgi:hypothetical protein
MAEEKTQDISMSQDDVHVLRILLHSIKGISPVSVTESEAAIYSEV